MFASFLPAALDNVTRLLAGEPPRICRNLQALPLFHTRLATLGAIATSVGAFTAGSSLAH